MSPAFGLFELSLAFSLFELSPAFGLFELCLVFGLFELSPAFGLFELWLLACLSCLHLLACLSCGFWLVWAVSLAFGLFVLCPAFVLAVMRYLFHEAWWWIQNLDTEPAAVVSEMLARSGCCLILTLCSAVKAVIVILTCLLSTQLPLLFTVVSAIVIWLLVCDLVICCVLNWC